MKIVTTTEFDEVRGCWRVRFRGAGLDTKLNVPAEEFETENVSPMSQAKAAQNVAEAWAVKKRTELLHEPAREAMSLEEIYALMKRHNLENVSEATWTRNDVHFRNLIRLPLNTPLKHVVPERIDRHLATVYRDERAAEGAKGRTIQGELALLKQLLRYGYEDAASLTGMTSVRFTKNPKIDFTDEESMVALTVNQFFAVLDATGRVMPRGGEVTRRRLIFGVTTMLRKTPLLGLRAEWIDLDDP